jgi:TolB protein
MLSRSLALVVALMLTLPRVALPQPNERTTELVVHPSAIQVSRIAVPPFEPHAGSETIQSGAISQVVERNLQISGWFDPVQAPGTDASAIDAWRRRGADHVVQGSYMLQGGQVVVEARVVDTSIGRQVLARSLRQPADTLVDVAHRIADEIVESITGERGIARSRILFISQTRRGRELALMDADGGRRRLLTQDGSTVMAACWGANNTEAYFTSTRDFNPDLCGIYLDGSRTWYISRLPGLNLSPAWNPRGQRLTLTLSRDGNSELYSMDREGKRLLRLTFQQAIDSSPTWGPDGRQILFTSDRQGGGPQIWAMAADGRGQRQLTTRRGQRYCDGASVSPDGRRVAFTSKVDGQFDIFVMDISGDANSWVRVTDHPADDEDPTWAWDGQHLAFSSTRSGTRQIHIMNADGSNVHQLTSQGKNLSPMAEPLPPGVGRRRTSR